MRLRTGGLCTLVFAACNPSGPVTGSIQQGLVCGDGVLDERETCDDGNETSSDGCSATCRLEPGFSCRPGRPCEETLCEVVAVGDSVFLRGNYLEIGLGLGAAFGVGEGVAAPAGWHPRAPNSEGGSNELGFVSDPDATGWTTFHGDFFTPGTPEEGWGIQVGEARANNNRASPQEIPGRFAAPQCLTEGLCRNRGGASVTWTADAPFAGLAIRHTYSILDGGVFIVIDVDVTNTTKGNLTDIFYMRNVDPDNDQSVHGSFETVNTIVSQPGETSTIAHVRADQSQLGNSSAISLVANDPRARVAFGGFDNRVPRDIHEANPNAGLFGEGTQTSDRAIALAFRFDLAAGETTRLRYAYNLEAEAEQAFQCSVPCGDGVIEGDEVCDDANTLDNDGCSQACALEEYFECDDGQPTVCTPICGDDVLVAGEGCEDGNDVDGDGCSAACTIEDGWSCEATPTPSQCQPICGDGLMVGGEACDDENAVGGDGCSSACTIEDRFQCAGEPSMCGPICGDGFLLPAESCDDNNSVNDDGCSAACTIEEGWECPAGEEPTSCSAICGDGLRVGPETCDDGNSVDHDGCTGCAADDADGDGIPDRFRVSGGGCSTGGGGGGGLAVLAMALFLARRRRRLGAALGLVLATAAPAAADTNFSVERFRLASDRDGIIGVESGAVQEHLAIDATIWIGYANDPLVLTDENGFRVGALVTRRMAANVTASVSLFDRFEAGLAIPVVVGQGSSGRSLADVPDVDSRGLGDVRLIPKVQLLRQGRSPVDLAVIASVTVPTAGAEDYRGDDGVTFAPEVAASLARGELRLAANAGYKVRKQARFNALAIDDEIFGAAGAAYDMRALEVSGALALGTSAASPFSGKAATYAELLAGVTVRPILPVGVSLIGGLGLNRGVGTPEYRVVLAGHIEIGGGRSDRTAPTAAAIAGR